MRISLKYKFILVAIVLLTTVGIMVAKSTFTADRLRQSCKSYIESLVGKEVEIIVAGSIRDQNFDDKGVTARCTGTADSFRGNCFVGLEFYSGKKLLTHLQVPVRVKFFRSVPIAGNAIKGGSTLESTDIRLERREITSYKEKDIPLLEDVLGKTAKGNISKGNIITRASLQEELSVRRGSKIMIVVQAGAVRISSMGEALQDGMPGQTVRVKREGTQTILEGVAAMDGSVFISLKQ